MTLWIKLLIIGVVSLGGFAVVRAIVGRLRWLAAHCTTLRTSELFANTADGPNFLPEWMNS